MAAYAAQRPRFHGRFVKPCDELFCDPAIRCWTVGAGGVHYHDPSDFNIVKWGPTPEHLTHAPEHGPDSATLEAAADGSDGAERLVGGGNTITILTPDPVLRARIVGAVMERAEFTWQVDADGNIALAEHAPEHPEQNGGSDGFPGTDRSTPGALAVLETNDAPEHASLQAPIAIDIESIALSPEEQSLTPVAPEEWDQLDVETDLPERVRGLQVRMVLLEQAKWDTGARIGAALLSAKKRIEHGRWTGWLTDQLGMQEDKAQRLMQLARPANAAFLRELGPDVTITAALREIRSQKQAVKLEQQAVSAMRQAPEIILPLRLVIEQADVLDLPIPPGSIDLIVTSPPYGLGIDYDATDDNDGYDAYLAKARDWAWALTVALKERGRLCLNVPFDVAYHGDPKPIYHDWLYLLQACGLRYRTTLVWHDDQMGRRTAVGSRDSQNSPYAYFPGEAILVLYRNEWDRGEPWRESDLTTEEQYLLANGYWKFQAGEQGYRSSWHPAPFPEELPRRLIKLFSFPGDIVMDPFGGSGITAVSAYKQGRLGYSFDRSAQYTAMARRDAGALYGEQA